ncbi:maltotransferase domain-containing protein [Microvirga massiliensis]|uniref:maltotransferase domain-containing protein n=1 Tax=Microvirga massiliensis TaxID=1033741 RepID=UPI00069B5D13|nr:maltotransferase domain-containing protein [Microvirga massiliensis]
MNKLETRAIAAQQVEPARNEPGPRIYNLFPLLVGSVSAWIAELPRIARMNFDWVYLNPFHETGASQSLYAIKNPFRLDQRFRDPGEEDDESQIRRFVEAASSQRLKVMTDLVINHTSQDADLARDRPDLYLRDSSGRLLSPFAVDPDDPTIRTVWEDLAELDLENPSVSDELLAYWDGYVGRLQQLGVKGFRCDAAYKVPPRIWRGLISAAKKRDPECSFVAETLGCTLDEAKATAGAGFDFLFNSFAWWDLHKPWALAQYEQLRTIAPSIAFPENHDMPRAAAALSDDPDAIADALKARYALAAFFSSGVLMPIGYEWGYRRSLHVVNTTPGDREMTGTDISDFIGAVNARRAELVPLNREGAQWALTAQDSRLVALLRLDSGHVEGAQSATLVLANPTSSVLEIEPAHLISRTGGLFGAFEDRTPDRTPLEFASGSPVTLEPHDVRIFLARRAVPAKPRSRPRQPDGAGRVVIENIWPEIDNGRAAVKRVVGETLEVWADIFSDGHDKIDAAVAYRGVGELEWRSAPMHFVDNDRWSGSFPLERNTRYQYVIEAWRDPFGSWFDEITKKRAAGQNVRLETIEGVRIIEEAASLAQGPDAKALAALLDQLRSKPEGSEEQLALMLDEANFELIDRNAERQNLSRSESREVVADRLAARFSAWYEIFPRSQSGDPNRHGTFDDVIARLPLIKDLGFDVLYFTPIHPIGQTNRKGRNNTLTPKPGDPGSVYAIGSEAGGHQAVHPELGTIADFQRLVAAAHEYGLEIALDFAIQCSPDHPWIKEHPEWFDWRPDGTIKFAENPPKKYEDIVNVHFYGDSLPSLWIELRDVVLFWVSQGVKIFRVDNPHTKPIPFWEWMIADVNSRHPDVIFLAEAFTRPKMMRKLAKIGFQQSYTYFTWRNTKHELMEYMTELAHSPMSEYYRPNFFANTPDINPRYLQTSGRAGFVVRGTLAATLSSVYGIYNGFELCEGTPIPGKEEYLDSEKYELKAWDYDRPGNIADHIRRLNRIRRENPALWDFRNILFLNAWNDQILAYARMTKEKDNCILALVNLDPHNRQECTYEVPLWEFGLPDHGSIDAEDLLAGGRLTLRGKTHRIALDPEQRPVVIWRLIPPGNGT